MGTNGRSIAFRPDHTRSRDTSVSRSLPAQPARCPWMQRPRWSSERRQRGAGRQTARAASASPAAAAAKRSHAVRSQAPSDTAYRWDAPTAAKQCTRPSPGCLPRPACRSPGCCSAGRRPPGTAGAFRRYRSGWSPSLGRLGPEETGRHTPLCTHRGRWPAGQTHHNATRYWRRATCATMLPPGPGRSWPSRHPARQTALSCQVAAGTPPIRGAHTTWRLLTSYSYGCTIHELHASPSAKNMKTPGSSPGVFILQRHPLR